MKNFIFLVFALFVFHTAATAQTKDRLPCIDKTFSIVVHIVNDSLHQGGVTQAAIRSTLVDLNTNFAPICVSFEICEFKIIDNFEYNNLEDKKRDWAEMQNQYHVKNRINIYYVESMTDPELAGKCGFSGELGGVNTGINNLNSQGIVIRKSCLDPKTLSREMGYFFGLPYTFGNGVGQTTELADGSNCKTTGDGICDTPADPYVPPELPAAYVDGTCKFISMKKDAKGQFYDPLVGNIMSYYPCSCGFTDEQYIKMATTYNPGMW